MKEALFSELARDDLDKIAEFSATNWGANGALYFDGLAAACESLPSLHPALLRLVPLFADLKSFRWEHHVIIVLERSTDFLIVRILHERMDPSRHLP